MWSSHRRQTVEAFQVIFHRLAAVATQKIVDAKAYPAKWRYSGTLFIFPMPSEKSATGHAKKPQHGNNRARLFTCAVQTHRQTSDLFSAHGRAELHS
ncbi:MAG: hypothetical protein IT423_23275 [Pirellulaceae bacterium]|nr:hypothetical protein [Pirellulaceae bacterium]